MKNTSPHISVIIVNYNGREYLHDCVTALIEQTTKLRFEVFIVDNNSTDESAVEVGNAFPQVTLIKNSENVGFAKANNQAIKLSRGRYILLLNPDTVMAPSALTQLSSFMESHPEAGAAGCKLLNSDGSIQYSIRNFPNLFNQLSECFFFHKLFPTNSVFGELVSDLSRYETAQTVDWVTGAALIIRREALAQIGELDEKFFMYSEEKDWCFRAWQNGWKVYYCPDATIVHYSGEYNTNAERFAQLIKSRRRFFSKHMGRWAMTYGFITKLNLIIRAGAWRVAVWAKRDRAKEQLYVYHTALGLRWRRPQ